MNSKKLFFSLLTGMFCLVGSTSTGVMARLSSADVTAQEDEKRLSEPKEMLDVIFAALSEQLQNVGIAGLLAAVGGTSKVGDYLSSFIDNPGVASYINTSTARAVTFDTSSVSGWIQAKDLDIIAASDSCFDKVDIAFRTSGGGTSIDRIIVRMHSSYASMALAVAAGREIGSSFAYGMSQMPQSSSDASPSFLMSCNVLGPKSGGDKGYSFGTNMMSNIEGFTNAGLTIDGNYVSVDRTLAIA